MEQLMPLVKVSPLYVIVVWILFGVFSAQFAKSRNRNRFGWFLMGLAFGPMGLLVLGLPKASPSPKHMAKGA